jgi:NAD(P)H-hydrate epimerase
MLDLIGLNGIFFSSFGSKILNEVFFVKLAITAEEMKKVDDLAVGKYGVLLEEMMELAGFHLASLARKSLNGSKQNKKIVLLAGKGNNGGGGLIAIRHLRNWGMKTAVILSQEKGLNETVTARLQTLKALDEHIKCFNEKMVLSRMIKEFDLVIDALIGYSLNGDPRYPLSKIIKQANASKTPILSLDLPSGLDATTGSSFNPCIVAKKNFNLSLTEEGVAVKRSTKFCRGIIFS